MKDLLHGLEKWHNSTVFASHKKPINVAVIGAGYWGPNLIRNFYENHASRVVAVADSNPSRLEQLRTRFADVPLTTDTASVLARSDVDAVVIATPTSTHAAVARDALRSGKHVLVEKPVTATATEARELVQLAEKSQRVLMVGHVFMYNPAVRYAKDRIDAGELGGLYYLSAIRSNLGPIRVDVNAAWDLASHDISIFNYWLGSAPESASAFGGAWINAGVEDAVFVTLRYPNHVLAHIHASWLNPRKNRDITVVGASKMLTFDDMNPAEPIRVYDKQVVGERVSVVDNLAAYRTSVRDGDIHIPRVTAGEPLRTECQHFLDCIAKQQPCVTDGVFGLGVVRTLEAITRSLSNHSREEAVLA